MYQVRYATESDRAQATEIYLDALQTADWLPPRGTQPLSFEAATRGEKVFVAFNPTSEVTGFLSVWTPESFVHHLFVHPQYRRTGVGSILLHSLDTWLPRPWTLKCNDGNVAALAFYRSLGWRAADTGVSVDGPYTLLRY